MKPFTYYDEYLTYEAKYTREDVCKQHHQLVEDRLVAQIDSKQEVPETFTPDCVCIIMCVAGSFNE